MDFVYEIHPNWQPFKCIEVRGERCLCRWYSCPNVSHIANSSQRKCHNASPLTLLFSFDCNGTDAQSGLSERTKSLNFASAILTFAWMLARANMSVHSLYPNLTIPFFPDPIEGHGRQMKGFATLSQQRWVLGDDRSIRLSSIGGTPSSKTLYIRRLTVDWTISTFFKLEDVLLASTTTKYGSIALPLPLAVSLEPCRFPLHLASSSAN